MNKNILLLLVFILLLSSCSTSSDLDYIRMVNGTGDAEYFGKWVNIFKDVLFWPYAIVFFILGINHDGLNWFSHIALTVALYISFHWDFAPLRAFTITYYVFMPLYYIPRVSNENLMSGMLIVSIIVLLFLGYKDWQYKGLILWIFDMAVWGFCAFGGCVLLIIQQTGRCPHCGHYALSWRSQSQRYEQAIEHYRYLSPDGSDMKTMLDDDSAKTGKQRCAHCLRLDKE